MKQYLELMRHVKEEGRYKEDRTGTGTLSVFGYQMRFNLAKGFPLVTTKQLHLKSIVHELIWFLTGNTNIQYLRDNGVKIWDEWSLTKSEFGKSFDKREIIYVEPRLKEYSNYYNPNRDLRSPISAGTPDDYLRNAWVKMMDRCYNREAHNYRWYGGKQVFVCERWHVLQNYIDDVKLLPNWEHKLGNWGGYNLDKDYYSSNCYSPETCLWLSLEENTIYGSENAVTIAVPPNGEAQLFLSISQASAALQISRSSVHRFITEIPDILKGKNKFIRGWKFGVINKPFRYSIPQVGDLGPVYGHQWRNYGAGKISKEKVLEIVNSSSSGQDMHDRLSELFITRPNNGIDQISNALQTLRNNPDSRRIVVSAWNPEEINDMALPPCHMSFQFYVDDLTLDERWSLGTNDAKYNGVMTDAIRKSVLDNHDVPTRRLSCQLYQRSA